MRETCSHWPLVTYSSLTVTYNSHSHFFTFFLALVICLSWPRPTCNPGWQGRGQTTLGLSFSSFSHWPDTTFRTLGSRAPWHRELLSVLWAPLNTKEKITQPVPSKCPTQYPWGRAGADNKVVSLAGPDVLQGQYGPISVPLALSDGLHTFTRLGEGQHLQWTVRGMTEETGLECTALHC